MTRILPKIVLAATLAAPGAALAQSPEIPCDTARLIVPWKAGGDTHVLFSIFEETIQRLDVHPKLKVVTMPGQSGNKGAKEAHEAEPDGCTLFAIHQSAITSFLNGRIDYHYDGFEPIANLTNTPEIIGANKNTPWTDWDSFKKDVLAHPGEYDVGATFGSTSQFMWLLLEEKTGMKFNYVPYDGTRERMTALLSGAVDLGTINMSAGSEYIEDGELKAFAIADDERAKELPDVPTLREKGTDLVFALRRGIMAPPGTPDEIVQMWADILEKAANDPKLLAQMEAKGTGIKFVGPKEFKDWVDETFEDYKKIAIKIGMYKPEG